MPARSKSKETAASRKRKRGASQPMEEDDYQATTTTTTTTTSTAGRTPAAKQRKPLSKTSPIQRTPRFEDREENYSLDTLHGELKVDGAAHSTAVQLKPQSVRMGQGKQVHGFSGTFCQLPLQLPDGKRISTTAMMNVMLYDPEGSIQNPFD